LIRAVLTCDALAHVDVVSAEIVEALSVPTFARIVVHAKAPIDQSTAIAAKATLKLLRDETTVRTFELVVFAASAIDSDRGDIAYEIELRHETALLALRRDARVFLDVTTKDVVTKVLDDAGISASASWSVERTLVKRDSCAQYRESDLDFVQRLLAEEGAFWFVKDGTDGIEFGDAKGAFQPITGTAKLPFSAEGEGLGIDTFEVTHETVSDVFTHTDFSEKTPGVDLRSTVTISDKKASEIFEYPGNYATQTDGGALAKVRAEEIASRSVIASGSATHPEMAAGATFEIGPAPDAIAKKWLLRSVTHRLGRGEADGGFACSFVCSPLDLPYRPARPAQRRAKELGAHVVTVGGADGEEIHTDDLGRMRGTFAYDRTAESNKMVSQWMRVVQPMLGGAMTIARVGWEVAVRYIDGDVDRPIAVARLLDATHPPAETLPAAATTTVLRTLSSPNGEKKNAIVMKDDGGSMLLTLLAAKDFDATVVHDRKETIGGDETLAIDKDATTLLGGKQTVTIDGDDTLTVKGDAGVAVAKDRDKTVTGAEKNTIGGKFSVKIAGADEEKTTGARTITVDDDVTETIEGERTSKVGGNVITHAKKWYDIYVAGKLEETISGAKTTSADDGALTTSVAGDYSITIGAARTETVTGKRLYTVQGDSSLTIGAAATLTASGKIQIKADKIKITAGGAANVVGGGGTLNVTPASVTLVGMITLKGSGGVELAGNPGMAG
jgi:type VI secretion system secreted protein VgrG